MCNQTTKIGKWKCGDGREVFIRKMSDQHLINSIKACKRMADSERSAIVITNFSPDSIAAFQTEYDHDEDDMRTDHDIIPKLYQLEKEIEKRGLLVSSEEDS